MDRQITVLARALELGDWRRVKRALGSSATSPVVRDRLEAHLLAAMRELAESVRLQTIGQVRAVPARVTAARRIVQQLTGSVEPGAEPARDREAAHALWRVSCVAWREQAELQAVRQAFSEASRGRTEVVLATVEYLTFVEFDPWTARGDSQDALLLGLDQATLDRFGTGNRRDICGRATELRQLGNARTGTVSDKIWQRVGGYPGFRAEALARLADEPLRRWAGHERIPVRRGRLIAWEFAQLVKRDTELS